MSARNCFSHYMAQRMACWDCFHLEIDALAIRRLSCSNQLNKLKPHTCGTCYMQIYIQIHTYINTHTYSHRNTSTQLLAHAHTNIFMQTCIPPHTHTHKHTYKRVHTHTHTFTFTFLHSQSYIHIMDLAYRHSFPGPQHFAGNR